MSALGSYVQLCSSSEPLSIVLRRPNYIPSLTSHGHRYSDIKGVRIICKAMRRRVRYDKDEDDEFGGEDYGNNEEIAMMEMYSQRARSEVLLVNALVDDNEVQVLIFKGFSSCLSYGTSPDPSRSVLPARAMIKSIDIIEGPFDPSNIQYLHKGLTWEDFKSQILPK